MKKIDCHKILMLICSFICVILDLSIDKLLNDYNIFKLMFESLI